jgi:hypothetical protein
VTKRLETLTKELHKGYRDLACLHRQVATELPIGVDRATHETLAGLLESIAKDYKGDDGQ